MHSCTMVDAFFWVVELVVRLPVPFIVEACKPFYSARRWLQPALRRGSVTAIEAARRRRRRRGVDGVAIGWCGGDLALVIVLVRVRHLPESEGVHGVAKELAES